MKQGRYFFSKLSPTEQEQFRTNYLNDRDNLDEYLDSSYDSKVFFMLCAFSWRNTDEGVEYWKQISKRKIK